MEIHAKVIEKTQSLFSKTSHKSSSHCHKFVPASICGFTVPHHEHSKNTLRQLGHLKHEPTKNVCNHRTEKFNNLTKLSKTSIKDYKFKKLIGTGKFSKVFQATDKRADCLVAIKVINKQDIRRDKLEHQIVREINIQSRLNHPNIVKLFTYFTDNVNIYLILEFVPGNEVYAHLKNSPSKRFSNRVAAKYIYQVCDALQYCHQNNVIHRDIKPENLILTTEGNIKLSDFGWSVHSPCMKRNTLCGTLDYIAPEMIRNEYYDERVDNWCIGVLCYEFLVGKPPFQSNNNIDTFQKISNVQITFPSYMCRRAVDLISKLLQTNPKNRLSLSGVKEHDWIVSKQILVSKRQTDF